MIVATAYPRNQRYQLAKLAEQPNLTLSEYEAQRNAILNGAEPFGECPEDWVRSSLPVSRTPKAETAQQILDLLRTKGEMATANLAGAFNQTDCYIRDVVLSDLLEQGLVLCRTITHKQGGKTFLWSLP